MDPLQSRPLLNWNLNLATSPRRFRCNHLNLKSLLIILTCLILMIIYLCTYATPSDWPSESRRLAHLATTKLQGAFGNPSSSSPIQSNPSIKNKIGNRKFLVRDWSPWLGWNNMRYIIETGLIMANLLDRELVLPGFTYATACEFDDQVCAKDTALLLHDVPVDLNSIPDSDRFKYPDPDEGTTILQPLLPSQNWKGWVLPLEVMLDVPYLTANWNRSISLKDYLDLTTPATELPRPSSYGLSSGKWSVHNNHGHSYRKVPNSLFADYHATRLDRLPPPIEPLLPRGKNDSELSASVPPQLLAKCRATLNKITGSALKARSTESSAQDLSTFPSWDDSLIGGDQMSGELAERDHELLERCIASRGYRSAYGYTMAGWWMKAPYGPTKYFRHESVMQGTWDQLHEFNETILHLEGELHNGFPPASMIWTTLEGRKNYETLVRTAVRPPDLYDRVAARLEERMRKRCEGRSWRAGHMRRGDFIAYEWTSKDINNQYNRIENSLNRSIPVLEAEPGLLMAAHKAYNTSLEIPRIDDPVYLATNARSKEELGFLRQKNVVLLNDLIDDVDRAELGFSAPFTDTLAIVEQCLIMRSAYFAGDGHSSVAGWILNRRVFHGIDEKLTVIEYLKQPGDGQRRR